MDRRIIITLVVIAILSIFFVKKEVQVESTNLASLETICSNNAYGEIYVLNNSYCLLQHPGDCEDREWAMLKVCGNASQCTENTMICSDGTTFARSIAAGHPYKCDATGHWQLHNSCSADQVCTRFDAYSAKCVSTSVANNASTLTTQPIKSNQSIYWLIGIMAVIGIGAYIFIRRKK